MIKTLVAGAAILTALALAAQGCGARREEVHAKVCVDSTTKSPDVYKRLADSNCESHKTGAKWRYYSGGTHINAVGQDVGRQGGSFTEPSGTLVRIPAKGGTANDVAIRR